MTVDSDNSAELDRIVALAHARAGAALAALSNWIDTSPQNARRDKEALTWGRLAKVAEEAGEVVRAFIGLTGQNPRKVSEPWSIHDVREELLDVAVTALAVVEHLDGHRGNALGSLVLHVGAVTKRAGLNPEGDLRL